MIDLPVESAVGVKPDRAVKSWILWDFANVLLSINIVSLYFPLWVVDNAGGRDAHVGVANGLAMLLVFCIAPLLGLTIDATGRRVPFLAIATVACAGVTLFLGLGGLWVSLALFALANVALSVATIFYDAILPHISRDDNRGRISGQGVAAGFAGALLGVAIGAAILAGDEANKPMVFRVTAIVFLLTSIPCLIWVKDSPPVEHIPFPVAFRRARANLRGIADRARAVKHLPRYLIGRIFLTDAANTMFAFMGIYATKEVGFSDAAAQGILAEGIVAGPIGAILAGRATDKIGPKRTMDRLLLLWIAVLGSCAAIPVLGLPRELFWLVAPFGGIAFGGTTTVDRTLLLQLSPPDRQGESFGLFAMIGRFSAILGPLLWALEVDLLHIGRPAAMATLALFVVVSLILFRPIMDHRST